MTLAVCGVSAFDVARPPRSIDAEVGDGRKSETVCVDLGLVRLQHPKIWLPSCLLLDRQCTHRDRD